MKRCRRVFQLMDKWISGILTIMKKTSSARLVRPLAKGQITLPVEFRRQLDIDSNTILRVSLKGDRIEIVPLRPVPRDQDLRDYSADEIEGFLKDDKISRDVATRVRRLLGRKKTA